MPLYEYECESCGNRFERIQKFSDPKVEICPTCGGKVRKLISSPAFQFKGSGFYITDYPKSESGRPAEKGSDEASGKGAGKTGDSSPEKSAKSDSKDAAAPGSASQSKSSGSTESGGSKPADSGTAAPKAAPKKD